MSKSLNLIWFMVVVACGSSGIAVDHETLGGLDYDVPSGWTARDQSEHQRAVIVWTPQDNPNLESVTIMRTEDLPALTKAGRPHIETLLDEAQRSLPGGKFSMPVEFTTKHGLAGVRIEGEFAAPGTARRYRRIHAVLIDGATLVHVLYTASIADREAFETVIDSLNHGEG
jgi:hypothetical protein